MEEHIKKLKQLDRIEYRIREMENNNEVRYGSLFAWAIMIITFIAVPSMVLLSHASGYSEGYESAKTAAILGLVAFSILKIVYIGFYAKDSIALKREYFDVVVKK